MASGGANWYRVLGVDRGADDKELRRAYLKRCKELHPDVNREVGADARFKRVQEAYSVLSDASKRAHFDMMTGGSAYRAAGASFQGGPDAFYGGASSFNSEGFPAGNPGAHPHHHSRRTWSKLEHAMARKGRWAFVALAPMWVIIAVGISTLGGPDPHRYDAEEPMVRAGRCKTTGQWVRPDAHNMHRLAPNTQLKVVPKSWLGSVDNGSRLKPAAGEPPAAE